MSMQVDPPVVSSEWIPILEAAVRAKCSVRTIYQKVREGAIPAVGIRRLMRVRLCDILIPYVPQGGKWIPRRVVVKKRPDDMSAKREGLVSDGPATSDQPQDVTPT